MVVLYKVNISALDRRLAGISTICSTSARRRHVFSPIEEEAIAENVGVMADARFLVYHILLGEIAQNMVIDWEIIQRGQSATPSTSVSSISLIFTTPLTYKPLYSNEAHWVD